MKRCFKHTHIYIPTILGFDKNNERFFCPFLRLFLSLIHTNSGEWESEWNGCHALVHTKWNHSSKACLNGGIVWCFVVKFLLLVRCYRWPKLSWNTWICNGGNFSTTMNWINMMMQIWRPEKLYHFTLHTFHRFLTSFFFFTMMYVFTYTLRYVIAPLYHKIKILTYSKSHTVAAGVSNQNEFSIHTQN